MAGSSCCGGTSFRRVGKKSACCSGNAPAPETKEQSACCGAQQEEIEACDCAPRARVEERWVEAYVQTPAGEVPRVATRLAFADVLGSWKCRWSIGRMDYAIPPGLYCVGSPNEASPVLVTANYKMTFDRLRMELSGVDAWIVVLDTDGVNVWCAAGKGTFGTDEVVRRVQAVGLKQVVTHRTLVLPQLAAPGVAAHEVIKRCGFRVVYGPVRASDLKAFLAAGMQATAQMREVTFSTWDRLVLTPMELVGALQPGLIAMGVLFLLNAIGLGHYGLVDLYALWGAVLVGCVVTPVLLPWIPGRAFAFKGALLGLLWAAGVNLIHGFPAMPDFGWLKAAAYVLLLPSIAAFCAMNFTGSSTYTSLSGVDKEMRIALPTMLIAAVVGVILLLVNDFLLVFG